MAAPVPSNFYWRVYLALNPDVGDDTVDEATPQRATTEHWLRYGQRENRQFLIPGFDWKAYVTEMDLDQSARGSEEDAMLHWLQSNHRCKVPATSHHHMQAFFYRALTAPAVALSAHQRFQRYMAVFSTIARTILCTQLQRKVDSPYVGVIVEPRVSKLAQLIDVLYNFAVYLGDTFNLVVVTNPTVQKLVQLRLPAWHIQFWNIPDHNLSLYQYSHVCVNRKLIEALPGEHVFFFQTDSLILRQAEWSCFFKYSFVGAPHGGMWMNHIDLHTPKGLGVNGGFSLRKRSHMLECLERAPPSRVAEYRTQHNLQNPPDLVEDMYYFTAMELLGFPLPTDAEASAFAVQDVVSLRGDSHPYLGIHGFDKKYLSESQYTRILSGANYALCPAVTKQWREYVLRE